MDFGGRGSKIVLIGSHSHTIDAKGRLFVPAKWREDLGSPFIVTRGFGKCLFGMSLPEWEKLSQKMAALPLTDRKAQQFVRSLSSWAIDCELDKQGRILIPAKLRTFADLTYETTLIGVTNRIEIWNAQKWEEQDQEIEDEYDDILASMAQMGI